MSEKPIERDLTTDVQPTERALDAARAYFSHHTNDEYHLASLARAFDAFDSETRKEALAEAAVIALRHGPCGTDGDNIDERDARLVLQGQRNARDAIVDKILAVVRRESHA
jgi:hypothetical protein